MQDIIVTIMNDFGYYGIAFLIAIENIFPPIPSEVILTFGGFMTTYTELNLWLVCLWATVGSVLGAVVLYWIGNILNEERLERLFSGKFGKIMHLKPSDVAKADKWFREKGKMTVFFCRFIPIVRSLISIPAGMSGMKLSTFLLLTTVGTAIWNIVLCSLGAFMSNSWEVIVDYIGIYADVILIALFISAIGFMIWFYKKRVKKEKHKKQDED